MNFTGSPEETAAYGMVIATTWVVFALLVGYYYHRKGGNAVAGFILAVLLSPVVGALVVAASKENKEVIEKRALKNGESKKCPFCAELVKAEAHVCRFCNRELSKSSSL